jgi:hypothetical protein
VAFACRPPRIRRERAPAAKLVMPMAVRPDRRFPYAAVRSKSFSVIQYAVDTRSGALQQVSTSPLAESFPYISVEKAELIRIVLADPDPEASGLSAFTRDDLVRICKKRDAKNLPVTSIGRILRELVLSRQKARPSHPEKSPAA